MVNIHANAAACQVFRRDIVPAVRTAPARPPGPRSFLPGAALRAMQRRPIAFLTSLAHEYGDVSHFSYGPQHLYFINHPDLIREVLVTRNDSFMKGRALQRAKLLLGEGLLTSEGELHKRQRRLAQPAFHRDRIEQYGTVMVERAEAMGDSWEDGQSFDVHHEMMRLTLAIVAHTLFGADVESEAEDVGGALTDALETFPLLINPFASLLQKLPLPRVKRLERALATLDRTIYRIIEARRAGGADRGDLLSMFLLAQDEESGGGGMSDRQLRDEVMTLFLAGHETTANALAWTWHLLSIHPHAESELHHEIDSVLGGRSVAPADYPRLPYAEMVLAESMRLFPPAWVIGRLAIEDVEIGGWTIPRGALAIVSQAVMHRDPRFWAEPDRFDPMRFAPAAKASRPRFAYFPFGGGPPMCIGEGFAWMEGVLALATIARRWRIFVQRDVEPLPLITLRPRGGMRGVVTARQH